MHRTLSPEIQSLMEAVHYRPAISIILPFEPKMSGSASLKQFLKVAERKVEKELLDNYSSDMVLLMMQKLYNIFHNVNYNTHKKSIAVYLSPVYEKVIYLDIPVEERIIVDESFEIRDLVYCKKQLHKYLLLQLNGDVCRMFLGNSSSFIKIVSNSFNTSAAFIHEPTSKTANFSDSGALKETELHKFLQQVDNALQIIMNAYPLPLFVIGPERFLGHFKKLSRHSNAVIEYIHGDYCKANEKELAAILKPHVEDWKKVLQKDLMSRLDAAAGANKLVFGIENVWRDTVSGKGRLLVVEKNFTYAAVHGDSANSIFKSIPTINHFSCIRDAVDDVIEKVLENGGDVEFTDKELLNNYEHIAMIKYY